MMAKCNSMVVNMTPYLQLSINNAPPPLSEYSPQSNSDEGSFPLSLFKITPFLTKSIGQN